MAHVFLYVHYPSGASREKTFLDTKVKTTNFNTYYDNIDNEFWRNLCLKEGTLRLYNKGDNFVEQGQIAPYLGYIKSGTLKYVAYGDDGSESVVGLEFAGEFVADFPFSLYGMKSRISIIAVTPCEIYCVSTRVLGKRMKSDEVFYRKVAETNVALFDTTYNRYINLHIKSARERYKELVERHKDIFKRFSLRDIASFLNITSTHLCRLRREYFKITK